MNLRLPNILLAAILLSLGPHPRRAEAGTPSLQPLLDRLNALRYQPTEALAMQGWVDHSSTWIADSSSRWPAGGEGLSLHTSRLVVGARGRLPLAGSLRYSILGGGSYAVNSVYEQRILTPEYAADLRWSPVEAVELGVFSRYGWRRPNAFLADSLRLRDWINGLRLFLHPLDHTELDLVAGNRRLREDRRYSDRRFARGELCQRLPFWNGFLIRANAESDWYGLADSLDFELQRTLGGLTLSGELPGGVQVYSYSGQVYREGVRRWVFHDRIRALLFGAHRLSAEVGSDWSTLREERIFQRRLLAGWSWSPCRWGGFRARLRGRWIERNHVDVTHSRDAAAGPVLDYRPFDGSRSTADGEPSPKHGGWKNAARDLHLKGHLLAGYKQSARYGDGVIGDGLLDFRIPLLPPALLSSELRALAAAEYMRLLDADTSRAGPFYQWSAQDLDENQLDFNTSLSMSSRVNPQGRISAGHRADWKRHLGTELVFSDDTLRNTISNEVWVRVDRFRQNASLAGMLVNHLAASADRDTEYRLSLRWMYRVTRLVSLSLRGVWRPESGAFDERLWLRAFAEVSLNKLGLNLDFRFSGDPGDLGQRDTQAWVHMVRRLW